MLGGEAVVAGVQIIPEHAEQVEVGEARPVIQQEGAVEQHLFEGRKLGGELGDEQLLLGAPEIDATAAELAFFVPQETEMTRCGHKFPVVDVIQTKADAFDIILDVTPEDALESAQFTGEEAELELVIEILGDDLGIFLRLEDDLTTVLQHRHLIVALLGELPDDGAVVVGDFDGLVGNLSEVEDASLNDYKRAVFKSVKLDHMGGVWP